MPRGLLFGPDLPAGKDRPDLPPKFKKTKRKTKRKATSRSKGEARSKVQRARKGEERKKKREEWLLMRAQRREEEKQRKADMGEPVVTKVKAKRDAKSHHGTEQVDTTIIKILGRSHKTHKKLAVKSKGEKVEEVAGPKWRHGMREEKHESRRVRAQPQKKSSEKVESKSRAAGEIIISSEVESTAEERQPKVVPTGNKADKLDWAEEKQSKLVPIVDIGLDYEAHGGLGSSGVGTTELAWPLPNQAPLQLMPPCMEFYQVRRE